MSNAANPEILAPAGSGESLIAAVRCGADAVYLGGKSLNARRSATGFDGEGLREAVRYCHGRGVKVYLALNTIAFDSERDELRDAVRAACGAGVDALIVQDLAAARLARECAPSLALHASTQMGVHSAEGARMLGELGFSRVVLARELSRGEIEDIRANTLLELEMFVHGALCMCHSGQCYFSAMLGGRSGNRGLCAQPCRLPFSSAKREYSLSLRDLSLIPQIGDIASLGVCSLKIEGRMKRPEYVAAAVTACRCALAGEEPDYSALGAVFSRSGFTSGYYGGARGPDMFGTRQKEDVQAAAPALLGRLAALYKSETPLVPVDMRLRIHPGEAASLFVSDGGGNEASASADPPQVARTAPTNREKAEAALSKTGGTPFFARNIECDIASNLMVPASALNALRREALDELLRKREAERPHPFIEKIGVFPDMPYRAGRPALRVRAANAAQLSENMLKNCDLVIIPPHEAARFAGTPYIGKIAAELPRIIYSGGDKLRESLKIAREAGVRHAVAGGLGAVYTARELGFIVHGDWFLNIANSSAIEEYANLGLVDVTLSVELTQKQIRSLGGRLPRGIVACGRLPLMASRNCPLGECAGCKSGGFLTDRLGKQFPVVCGNGVSEVLNSAPLWLADRLGESWNADFFTLWFTIEDPHACSEIFESYRQGAAAPAGITRGLYYRGVL